MIQNATFVVVDTETTGTTGATDRIIEIGATKVRNGEIVDTFHALLNPQRFIPHNVMQIHNITDRMVSESPVFSDIAENFLSFMGENGIFTAHNVEFDKDFINHELRRIGLNPMQNQSLCTIRLAKKVFPGLRRYGLTALCERFGIERPNAHRALDDSVATAKILLRTLTELETANVIMLNGIGLKSLPITAETISMF